jgi:outer membrane protein assembly factor BamA
MHRKLLLFALLTVWGISYANAQVVEAIPLDTLGKKVVTDFIFEGNKLTQERIILREITFGVGDSLHWSNLKAGMAQ